MIESKLEEPNPIAPVVTRAADARGGAVQLSHPAPQVAAAAQLRRQRPTGTDAQHGLRFPRPDRRPRFGVSGDLRPAQLPRSLARPRSWRTAREGVGLRGGCRESQSAVLRPGRGRDGKPGSARRRRRERPKRLWRGRRGCRTRTGRSTRSGSGERTEHRRRPQQSGPDPSPGTGTEPVSHFRAPVVPAGRHRAAEAGADSRPPGRLRSAPGACARKFAVERGGRPCQRPRDRSLIEVLQGRGRTRSRA
jgi:hypothetical protein